MTYDRQWQNLLLTVAEFDMLLTEDIAGQTRGTVDSGQRETIAIVAWVGCGTIVLIIVLAARESVTILE